MTASPRERAAMRRALALAATPGAPLGPNPRVGCVLLGEDGAVLAEGWHRGAGTAHAEVDALAQAGSAARGSTAVVTLEPCSHTGRTGPCTQALLEAGVRRVVLARRDPNPVAAGGVEVLRAAGVEVVTGVRERRAAALNRAWEFGLAQGRPLVTWKCALTLDGRSAAADGTSRWVSNSASRADAHRLRAACDTILAGTGTALMDDCHLTVRDADGGLAAHQPLRVVLGERALPSSARVLDAAAPTLVCRHRDPQRALAEVFAQGRRHVLLEGGPRVAASFLRAGLIDEIVAYVAPTLLGAGPTVVTDLGISTMADALPLALREVTLVPASAPGEADNVRLTLTPRRP